MLGAWLSQQHNNYKLYHEGKPSSMTAERSRELESIGFDWGTSNKTDWSAQFQQLCEYKEHFGNCLVPQQYAANPMLGAWLSQQRYNYKLYHEGKPSPMTAERSRELESIGFDWGTSNKTDWSAQFQQLCEYKEHFGNCLVPQQYAANPKLGTWVKIQRRKYKFYQEGKPSPMTAERSRALDSIGFDWGTSNKTAFDWSARFQQLREYKAQFGNCLVPQQYAANPKLGTWVSTQRRNYRLYQEGSPSPMTEKRIQELESIGFDWGTTAAF
jgi:hypothetical protein